MACLTKGQPECWQVFDTKDASPSLCSGEKRYGGLTPIVFLKKKHIRFNPEVDRRQIVAERLSTIDS